MLREEVAEIVREELLKILGGSGKSAGEWIPLKDAVGTLGYASADALRRDIAAGLFRVGKEIRDRRNPGSKKPIYQINVELAQKRLLEDPSKRRAV